MAILNYVSTYGTIKCDHCGKFYAEIWPVVAGRLSDGKIWDLYYCKTHANDANMQQSINQMRREKLTIELAAGTRSFIYADELIVSETPLTV